MRSILRFALPIAAVLLGLLISVGVAHQARAAVPLDGAWTGAGHALAVSGTLEGGFTVSAAESWSVIGCPIAAGTLLTRYSPKGGGSYDATYLWTENTDGTCTNTYRGPETVSVTGTDTTLVISGCGYAFCGTLVRSGPTTTTPTTTTTTTTPDTTAPVVRAFEKPGLIEPGMRTSLDFSVSDDSGQATTRLVLFNGGTDVASLTMSGPANGARQSWPDVQIPAGIDGPLFFCVSARDAAGNVSANAPRSRCAWTSLLVPVEAVSNGCGGRGWAALEAAQNYLGNRHTYWQSLRRSYTVNFKAACDLHDAGYGGQTVPDAINGGTVDYRTWSRPHVDRKFLADMHTLCREKIPASATNAMEKCLSRGGPLSIGSRALFDFVQKHGWRFFDADLTKPGIQRIGHRRQFD